MSLIKMETAENEGSAWVPVLTSYNGEHHAHTARKGRYMKRVKTLIPGNKKKGSAGAGTSDDDQRETRRYTCTKDKRNRTQKSESRQLLLGTENLGNGALAAQPRF